MTQRNLNAMQLQAVSDAPFEVLVDYFQSKRVAIEPCSKSINSYMLTKYKMLTAFVIENLYGSYGGWIGHGTVNSCKKDVNYIDMIIQDRMLSAQNKKNAIDNIALLSEILRNIITKHSIGLILTRKASGISDEKIALIDNMQNIGDILFYAQEDTCYLFRARK